MQNTPKHSFFHRAKWALVSGLCVALLADFLWFAVLACTRGSQVATDIAVKQIIWLVPACMLLSLPIALAFGVKDSK